MPAALLFTVVGLWMTRRAPRTDSTRASIIAVGRVARRHRARVQPDEGDLPRVLHGGSRAGDRRDGGHRVTSRSGNTGNRSSRASSARPRSSITALWSSALLGRAPGWNAWLRPVITVGAIVTAGAMLLGPRVARGKVFAAAAIGGVVVSLLGSTAWAVQTAATPHAGSIVTAGPGVLGGRSASGRVPFPGGNRPAGSRAGGFPGGGARPAPGSLPGAGTFGPAPNGALFGGGFGGAPTGGLLNASTSEHRARADAARRERRGTSGSRRRSARIRHRATSSRRRSRSCRSEASTDRILLRPWRNSSSTSRKGRIHYFIPSGGFGRQNGGSDQAREITSWVEENFSPTQVDGVTLFDLSA